MSAMGKKQSGFTIVELLIVIVVIAILATISIVVYNGVQQRAINTQTVSAVKSFQDILMTYSAEHGSYPSNVQTCLGETYSDYNGDGIGDCYDLNNGNRTSINAPFNNSLKSVASFPYVPNTPITGSDGIYRVGIVFRYVSSIPEYQLIYFLKGAGQDCGFSNIVISGGNSNTTWCGLRLPNP